MLHEHVGKSRIAAGIILVGLGLLLLIGQMTDFSFEGWFEDWNIPYPVYVIVPGVLIMAVGLFGGSRAVGVTIFGSIVLVTGILLAYQDATNDYETWAYLWSLVFPGAIGLGLAVQGLVTQDSSQRKTGLRLMAATAVLVLVLWSIFEGAFHIGGNDSNEAVNFVGPLLLIAIGGWILLRQGFPPIEKKKH